MKQKLRIIIPLLCAAVLAAGWQAGRKGTEGTPENRAEQAKEAEAARNVMAALQDMEGLTRDEMGEEPGGATQLLDTEESYNAPKEDGGMESGLGDGGGGFAQEDTFEDIASQEAVDSSAYDLFDSGSGELPQNGGDEEQYFVPEAPTFEADSWDPSSDGQESSSASAAAETDHPEQQAPAEADHPEPQPQPENPSPASDSDTQPQESSPVETPAAQPTPVSSAADSTTQPGNQNPQSSSAGPQTPVYWPTNSNSSNYDNNTNTNGQVSSGENPSVSGSNGNRDTGSLPTQPAAAATPTPTPSPTPTASPTPVPASETEAVTEARTETQESATESTTALQETTEVTSETTTLKEEQKQAPIVPTDRSKKGHRHLLRIYDQMNAPKMLALIVILVLGLGLVTIGRTRLKDETADVSGGNKSAGWPEQTLPPELNADRRF